MKPFPPEYRLVRFYNDWLLCPELKYPEWIAFCKEHEYEDIDEPPEYCGLVDINKLTFCYPREEPIYLQPKLQLEDDIPTDEVIKTNANTF